jgi:hypothetical protein
VVSLRARLPDAARDNDWEAVRELLFELGASAIDHRDDTGSNLLHWAIRHGKTRLIRVSHSAPRVLCLSFFGQLPCVRVAAREASTTGQYNAVDAGGGGTLWRGYAATPLARG